MKPSIAALALLFVSLLDVSAALIARNGVARTAIVVDPSATPVEIYAARQLAGTLQQITGASFEIETNARAPKRAIIIGAGAAASESFPDAQLSQLGGEE